MIRRKQLKLFSGMWEGFLEKINLDFRMGGVEKVLAPETSPKKLLH